MGSEVRSAHRLSLNTLWPSPRLCSCPVESSRAPRTILPGGGGDGDGVVGGALRSPKPSLHSSFAGGWEGIGEQRDIGRRSGPWACAPSDRLHSMKRTKRIENG